MKKRNVAVSAALAAIVTICAALAASTGAFAAGTAASGERFGPLTLHVICVELVTDAESVKDKVWRVHFGYSTTAPVSPETVKKSEFEDAPGWSVVAGNAPADFQTSGFSDTGGAVVEAIVAQNEPGYGRESIKWDVDLRGPHDFGPAKARFDGDTMGPSSCPAGLAAADGGPTPEPVRAIYCSADGNSVNGVTVPAGTALNLRLGQPNTDPSYKGATPAIFVQGIGATCDPPPAGFTFDGKTLVDGMGEAHGLENAIYPYFVKP